MPNIEFTQAKLYECKHCLGTGTCTTGNNQHSCHACVKRSELPFWQRKNQSGIICSVCSGLGVAEPTTDRMNKRIAPLLAIFLIFFLLTLLLIALVTESKHFSELLAFTSAIIGSIVGYYFSSKNK